MYTVGLPRIQSRWSFLNFAVIYMKSFDMHKLIDERGRTISIQGDCNSNPKKAAYCIQNDTDLFYIEPNMRISKYSLACRPCSSYCESCKGIFLPNRMKGAQRENECFPDLKHSAISLFRKKAFYVTGGKGFLHEGAEDAPEDRIRNCVYKYCLKDQEWSVQPSMNFPRCRHSSCVVAKHLYVLGGVNLMTIQ